MQKMPINTSVEPSSTSINIGDVNPFKQTTPDKVNVVDNSVKWMQMSNKTKIIAGIISFVVLLVIILSSTLTQPSHNSGTNTQNNEPEYLATPSDDGIDSAPDNYIEPVTDNPNNCNNKLPYGPISSNLVVTTQLIDICHSAYYAKFDPNAKIPLFTTYMINSQTIAGCYSKDNVRKPTPTYSRDPNTTVDQSAKKSDYQGSGYDHGHLAPASDLGYNKNVLYESYYYTNLAPQLHSFNAGRWAVLENSVRYWALPQIQNGHQIQIIWEHFITVHHKNLKIVL
jgi:DNA/RNA endonuclease G (NUC1)